MMKQMKEDEKTKTKYNEMMEKISTPEKCLSAN